VTALQRSTNRFDIINPSNERPEKIQIILSTVQQIPFGRVATYGQIAQAAGLPGYARYVGQCLKNHASNLHLPWHRVINQQGKISFPEDSSKYLEQRSLLESEGVALHRRRINLKQYQWQP